MSNEAPPVNTETVSHDTHVVNSSMPPISSLATASNIPPVMTWNSYVGLNSHAGAQTIGVSSLDGIPRPVAQVIPRNYPTGYHTSAPVYGNTTLDTPVRQTLDTPTIRQSLEAPLRQTLDVQIRQTIEEPIRHTPPPASNSVAIIDPSGIIDSAAHMASVRPISTVTMQDRLAIQNDTSGIMTATLDESKLTQATHAGIPTTSHQLSMVQNLLVADTQHQMMTQQGTLIQAPHSVAAYSEVTHAVINNSQTPQLTTHLSQLAHTATGTPPLPQQPQQTLPHQTHVQPPSELANVPTVIKSPRRGKPSGKTSRKSSSPRLSAKHSQARTRAAAASTAAESHSSLTKDDQMDFAEVLKNVSMVPNPSKANSRKLKRKAYSIREKLKTVERVKGGEPRSKILRDMGIPDSTLRGWMKDEEKLRTFAFNVDIKKKKARTAKDTLLDSVLYSWYLQQKDRGMSVSGAMLKTKADELNKDINGENNFKASAGWLYRFQKRHNLGKQRDPEDESQANVSNPDYKEEILHFPYDQILKNQEAAAIDDKVHNFCQHVRDIMVNGGYRDEQVYTCDETGFFYKLLPDNNFLVPSDEPSCANSKRIRDRVTLLLCVNKTGQHRLKPLCVGKYRSPRGFQHVNVTKLPFWYKCSHNAWMTQAIFKDWFYTCFIPEVKHHLRSLEIEEKAILLLDENPAHPPGEVLSSIDGDIQVVFLPKDTTSVVQPLDQGIMANFKSNYRHELIKNVVSADTDVKLFLRHLSLKRMMFFGEKAWLSITPRSIEKLWYKCLPTAFDPSTMTEVTDPASPSAEASDREKAEAERVFQQKLELAGIETSIMTIREWMSLNENLPTTDICASDKPETEEMVSEPSEDEDDNQSKVPSNAEAVKAFEIGLQWLESKNIDYITILQVQSILDYARYERRNELSQLNSTC